MNAKIKILLRALGLGVVRNLLYMKNSRRSIWSYRESNRRNLPEQVTSDPDLEEQLSVCIQTEDTLDAPLDSNFIHNVFKNRESLYLMPKSLSFMTPKLGVTKGLYELRLWNLIASKNSIISSKFLILSQKKVNWDLEIVSDDRVHFSDGIKC